MQKLGRCEFSRDAFLLYLVASTAEEATTDSVSSLSRHQTLWEFPDMQTPFPGRPDSTEFLRDAGPLHLGRKIAQEALS